MRARGHPSSRTADPAAERGLCAAENEVKRTTGQRVRDLVVTSPVTAFEMYRAEAQQILRQVGVRRIRFIDEPVAAALGYGISLSRERVVLVVDVGPGVDVVANPPAGTRDLVDRCALDLAAWPAGSTHHTFTVGHLSSPWSSPP